MDPQDFRVDMVGHATLRIRSGSSTLVTDPWLLDPIGCASGFHFPPLVHDPVEVAATADVVYLSHPHPDHFHAPSLDLFPRHVRMVIGEYRRKDFRDAVAAMGFPVVEVPFATPLRLEGTPFEVAILEHDYAESAARDSALVVKTPGFTLFENNDCFLTPGKYRWVRERYDLDYAFLGYSPASFYPVCFEMDEAEKARLLQEAADRRYGDFVEAARILEASLTVPFASGARFFLESALWKNVGFNSVAEALRRLAPTGLAGLAMGPGDRILADGSTDCRSRALEADEEREAVAAHALGVQEWVKGFVRERPPADPGLPLRMRDWVLERRRRHLGSLPELAGCRISVELTGTPASEFHFDFSRPEPEIFGWGRPSGYDMRYTYDARDLEACLDGEIDWDELHFTNEVRVHQVRYARDYYRLLRSELLDELG